MPSAEDDEDEDSKDSMEVRDSGESPSCREVRASSFSRDVFDRTGDRDSDLLRARDGSGKSAWVSALGSRSMAAELRDVRGEPYSDERGV